ncbi:hypothetical protein Tco_0610699 [Tanacetum coccineum]
MACGDLTGQHWAERMDLAATGTGHLDWCWTRTGPGGYGGWLTGSESGLVDWGGGMMMVGGCPNGKCRITAGENWETATGTPGVDMLVEVEYWTVRVWEWVEWIVEWYWQLWWCTWECVACGLRNLYLAENRLATGVQKLRIGVVVVETVVLTGGGVALLRGLECMNCTEVRELDKFPPDMQLETTTNFGRNKTGLGTLGEKHGYGTGDVACCCGPWKLWVN